MNLTPIALIPLALGACSTPSVPGPADQPLPQTLTYAAIGQTVYVDGPRVTPLEILEDSRCPVDVTCIWAGRVRISARIDLGSGDETRELTLGRPIQVADGSLELVEVLPKKHTSEPIAQAEYRFGLRFMGGL